jgi:heme-degrading monooxygenase HmoA
MCHLAQLNVAKMKYAYEDVRVAEFVNALDRVNASAEASPGFVWRLETDDDDAETFGEENLLVNLSVWESLSHLRSFVRSEMHLAIM